MHHERAEERQDGQVRQQQEEVRRTGLPASSRRCGCREQCQDDQDAQHDGKRKPGDPARILRLLHIERNPGGFPGGQRAEAEDYGNVVDVGANNDADALAQRPSTIATTEAA